MGKMRRLRCGGDIVMMGGVESELGTAFLDINFLHNPDLINQTVQIMLHIMIPNGVLCPA
jgi:hypothetical protein